MCYIQKIFYRSRPTGIIVIRSTMHFMKRSIIPLRKSGYIFYRIAECNPYPIVLFLRLVDFNSRFGGRYLVWMSRKADALPFFVIRPAMIRTNERLLFYFAQREPCASMKAEITPGMNFIINTPQNDILF